MKTTENKAFIDIDDIFRSKNPGLYKLLPGIFLRWLKKVVHQDEINHFIVRNGHKTELSFVDAIITEFGCGLEVSGMEHIPATGGFIVAANHPLGGLDGMALVKTVGHKREDIRFIVNDILLRLENLKGIFAGVNKHGKNTPDVYSTLDSIYGSGMGMLIFPAGLVSRKQKGKIKDLEWKKSFVTKSRQFQLPVIPAYIEGKNSPFFYNLSKIRTLLGIKLNIEMLFLADEMYRQRGKTIRITFGKPIPHTMFESSYTDKEWASLMREHIYLLESDDPFAVFRKPSDL